MITVVITSYNRRDLLQSTIESLSKFIDYPIKEFIIIEDSADKDMRNWLIHYCRDTNFKIVLNEKNIGAYQSIDKAYSFVSTPFVVHCEDDWRFTKSGFTERALKVLESNPMIMQVNLSNENNQPIIYNSNYSIFGDNDIWHGFTCNPSIRSMAAYAKTKPWTQWIDNTRDLAVQECMVGLKYHELGYKAAYMNESFCKHIGIGRCTWHENL